MQIIVSGKHVELSDALHERVWKDLDALGQRYPDRERMTAHVTFERERRFFVCKISLQTNTPLRSHGSAADAYAAFDAAMNQMGERLAEARLKRYHRRQEPAAEAGFRSLLRPEEGGDDAATD